MLRAFLGICLCLEVQWRTIQDGQAEAASASRVPSAALHGSTRQAPESGSGPLEQHLPPPEEQTAHVLLCQRQQYKKHSFQQEHNRSDLVL